MSLTLDTEDSETWKVAGDLTFASVPEVQDKSPGLFSTPPRTLDLGGVERIDSAGIALVMEWARRARAAGVAMRLVNVPSGMNSLSKTTGLDRLLNIDGSS